MFITVFVVISDEFHDKIIDIGMNKSGTGEIFV